MEKTITRFTLSDALLEFADQRDEIKTALTENMLDSISKLRKPSAPEGSDLRWVQNEVYKCRLRKITEYPTRVINRINASQQPVRVGAITDDMIERAREYPIEDLYDGQLRGGMGRCPFHDDRNASMSMQKYNRWMCFSGCGGGDSIDYYMKTRGVSFTQAVRALAIPTHNLDRPRTLA